MERKETATSSNDFRNPVFFIERTTGPVLDPEISEDQKGENSRTAGRWTVEEHRKFIEGIETP